MLFLERVSTVAAALVIAVFFASIVPVAIVAAGIISNP